MKKWPESRLPDDKIDAVIDAIRFNIELDDMLCTLEPRAFYHDHDEMEMIILRPALTDISDCGLIPKDSDHDGILWSSIRGIDIKQMLEDLAKILHVNEFDFTGQDPNTRTELSFAIEAVIETVQYQTWTPVAIRIFDEPWEDPDVLEPALGGFTFKSAKPETDPSE